MRKRREAEKAAGTQKVYKRNDEQKLAQAERMRRKREEAKAGGFVIPGDDWAAKNPGKQRARVARWRGENPEKAREIARENQAARRSTPWGQINNNMWARMSVSVRNRSTLMGKYNAPLGYTWLDLALHLERQFTAEMNWWNWGTVWEVDHIKPLRLFQYTSLDDPLFKEAWALSNLRPLSCVENMNKGSRHAESE